MCSGRFKVIQQDNTADDRVLAGLINALQAQDEGGGLAVGAVGQLLHFRSIGDLKKIRMVQGEADVGLARDPVHAIKFEHRHKAASEGQYQGQALSDQV